MWLGFAGYSSSGAPGVTNPRPSCEVELEVEHCATVENSENATDATPPSQSGEAPNDIDDVIIEDWSHINIDAIKIRPSAGAGNGRGDGYPHGEQRKGRRVTTYLYRNHLGAPHTKVEKRISSSARHAQYPQSFYVNGVWANKKPPGWLKIPYRLPEMLAALARNPSTDVFIPEGEKDAETLAALGLIATTSSEGATNPKSKKASNWTSDLNKWFAGVKRVFILEDNDEPGRGFGPRKGAGRSPESCPTFASFHFPMCQKPKT